MSDDAAWLAQIRAAPEDDGPRQIYADVLLAREDLRGAFINAQCELARIAAGDPRRPNLVALERRLLREHRKQWVRLPTAIKVTFRRGFIDEIHVAYVRDLHANSAAIRAAAPLLRRVTLTTPLTVYSLDPLLEAVSAIGAPGLVVEPEVELVGDIVHSTVVGALRELRFGCPTPRTLVALGRELARMGTLPRLEVLALTGPGVMYAWCVPIAQSPVGRQLRLFDVRDSPLTDLELARLHALAPNAPVRSA